MMKVKVEEEKCIKCGICPDAVPEHFSRKSDDSAVVYKQPENMMEVTKCKTMAMVCPSKCIQVEEC